MCISINYDESQLLPVILSTDGSHFGHDGGWAYVKRVGQFITRDSGYCVAASSTETEVEAIFQALRVFSQPREILLRVDSKSALRFAAHFYHGMQEYLRPNDLKIIRREIRDEIGALLRMHKITFMHVKGHTGDEDNEACDKLAYAAMKKKPLIPPAPPVKKKRPVKKKVFRGGSLDHLMPDGRLMQRSVTTTLGAPPREFPRPPVPRAAPTGIAWALAK